tara:strand:- start:2857 stop:3108 length:252 start_codon:yes stop_codon:yes gene_type:complete
VLKTEKYPENIPWDSHSNLEKADKVVWMLYRDSNVYIFSKSSIDTQYVYIQKNKGKKNPVKEYTARLTYQRLFDDGYELAAVA